MSNINEAIAALENLYFKVLKVNVTEKTFEEIRPAKEEVEIEKHSYNEWVHKFAASDIIHPHDVEEFIEKMSFQYLKTHDHIATYYRRKYSSDFYEWVFLEAIKIDKDNVMIYIRNVDNKCITELFELKDTIYSEEKDLETDMLNLYTYQKYIDDFDFRNFISLGVVYAEIDKLDKPAFEDFCFIFKSVFTKQCCYRVDDNKFYAIIENIDNKDFSYRIIEFYRLLHRYNFDGTKTGNAWAVCDDPSFSLINLFDEATVK